MSYDYGHGMTERFARDTANHQMTVLHDDGLYRHLQFRACWWQPPLRKQQWSSIYWFDLITIPGTLIFQGDGESYVFSRVEDMFEFFRGQVGRINPGYWAEKLTCSRREGVKRYDQALMTQHVNELVAEFLEGDGDGALAGLADAVQKEILDELIGDYSLDLALVERFEYYVDPKDQYAIPRKAPDFEFSDVWEWNCQDYDWWFLWALHGIVWGIAQYDAARVAAGAL